MIREPDFRLDGFEADDASSEFAKNVMWPGHLALLAEYHTPPDGAHSFMVVRDRLMDWGEPGDPTLVAVEITRDLDARTFTIDSENHATIAFAQNWLIQRGCPPEQITHVGDDVMKPADDLTLWLDRQIRESGARYEVIDSYTSHHEPCETWALTRDSSASRAPIRIFLEERNQEAHTYTVREGAFADEAAARYWLDDRSTPLPQPPDYRGEAASRLARAALYRSPGTSVTSKACPDTGSAPSAGTPPRPGPRRSM
ncbi:glycosyl hydrolase [Streptomyces sioyaensis]|uniref:glycosyl hydrolase n=1 Tax=Streptomyces sioyaensis TaxID=67364 RepID=UPI0036980A28